MTTRTATQQIWTRKQAGARVRGTLGGTGGRRCPALVDDSAGYHARVTEWRWAAGVGASRRRARVALEPRHGRPRRADRVRARACGSTASRRGRPRSRSRPTWTSVTFAEGGALRFAARRERARSDDLLIFASDYRQPFGTVRGALPGGVELAAGSGVMERHRARW